MSGVRGRPDPAHVYLVRVDRRELVVTAGHALTWDVRGELGEHYLDGTYPPFTVYT